MSNLGPTTRVLVEHAEPSELREARLEAFDAEGAKVVCLFGLGDGSVYEQVQGDHRLVFLEPDAGVIRALLDHPLMSDPRVEVHHIGGCENDLPLYRSLAHRFLGKKMHSRVLPGYAAQHREIFCAEWDRIHHLGAELIDHGEAFFRNFYANWRSINGSYRAEALYGKFEGMPAIICGNGPGLEKQQERLAGMHDRALIMAAGSAIGAIDSHVGGALDPNATQLEAFSRADDFERPIFYRSRLLHAALEAIHGPRLYVGGASGYPVCNWLEQQVGLPADEIEGGYNVVNFLTSIAVKLGCDPVVYVGMNLSVEDGSCPIRARDIYGREVTTERKWLREAEWIGAFAKKHPQTLFYNATEGGIGMPGVLNARLCDVDAYMCEERFPIREMIHQHMGSKIAVDPEPALCELEASLKRCIGLLNEPLTPLSEHDLHEEIAYQQILCVFADVSKDSQFLVEAAKKNLEWMHGSF